MSKAQTDVVAALRIRVEELEAELAEVRRVLGGDHSFPMSYLAAQVSAEKLGFKRMLKERDEAERSLTEARASEAKMRVALNDARDKLASAMLVADEYVVANRTVAETNWRPLRDRLRESHAQAVAALSDDDDACHRLLDQALGEGTSNDTSMETLLERLPRLVARAEKAEAEMAELREALANLEAACASVASWSEECLDYSDATRVAARKLLAKLEG